MPTLGDLVDLLHAEFPPATAAEWDRVGLVTGDPAREVRRVLLAVDPAPVVADEAAAYGADLLITHHPLFLRPIHGIAPTTPKARTLATLLRADCGLLCAHTNADAGVGGVADAVAAALGLTDTRPLVPAAAPAMDKLTTYVPVGDADAVRAALAAAGAGAIGDYDACSFSTPGQGRFRPLAGAHPAIGEVGRPEVVDEVRIECVLPSARRTQVVRAMRAAHPYEEPAFDVVALADPGESRTGIGRIGTVAETTLADFARQVAGVLPATPRGVLVGGRMDRVVRTVAVSPGAGDEHLPDALAAGADVYVTSDLRHHPATEFLEQDGPALIDVSHWASEWLWLPRVATLLASGAGSDGGRVEVRVSTLVTDAWTMRIEGDTR